MWKASRAADFSPMPGSLDISWINRASGAGYIVIG
jgi:hypothetical protein